MISLLGRGFVLAAVAIAAFGAVAGIAGGLKRSPGAQRWAVALAYAFAALMLAANLLMEYALLAPDFSVHYAAQVASRASPTWVAVVSLWSSLEGSILFWGLVLGGFVAVLAFLARKHDSDMASLALGIALAVAVFFGFLIAGPADPFRPVFPVPFDGPGPNPLLQNHVLMVVHPPALYLGYVGMTVPFAIACAALLLGRLDRGTLRLLRWSLLSAWIFLTAGIVLGGWWAYEVLGWGGYWAWDPVENASLLPWLTATAALHSLLVVERRGALKGWTLTLVLASFLLTILGTFMTRSGIFNSVHAFSQSDIGPTFLVFLALAGVFSVGLLSARLGALEPDRPLGPGASREAAFLANNVVLVTLTLTVLLGTVFPLVLEAVEGTRISVGEPYYNRMAVPLGVALLFLMAIGPALPWGGKNARQAARKLLLALAFGLLSAAIAFVLGARSPGFLATLLAGGMALVISVREAFPGPVAAGGSSVWRRMAGSGRRRLASHVVHLGLIVVLAAVGASTSMRESAEVSLAQGETASIDRYQLTYVGAEAQLEPHRQSLIARTLVSRDDEVVAELRPRLNHYLRMREPVGTPDVLTLPEGDVYLSLMSLDEQGARAGFRAFFNPFVAWIWIGAGLMVLGAVVALLPRPRAAPSSLGQGRPDAERPDRRDRVESGEPKAAVSASKASEVVR